MSSEHMGFQTLISSQVVLGWTLTKAPLLTVNMKHGKPFTELLEIMVGTQRD